MPQNVQKRGSSLNSYVWIRGWSEPPKTGIVGFWEKLGWIALGWVTQGPKGLTWIGGDAFCHFWKAVGWPIHPELQNGEKTEAGGSADPESLPSTGPAVCILPPGTTAVTESFSGHANRTEWNLSNRLSVMTLITFFFCQESCFHPRSLYILC